jgi:hypothetical protein
MLQIPFILLHGTCQFAIQQNTEISIYVFKQLRMPQRLGTKTALSRNDENPTWGVEILYGGARIRQAFQFLLGGQISGTASRLFLR